MLTQEQWRASRVENVTEMTAIMELAETEDRALSDEEQTRFDAHAKTIEDNDEKMKRAATLEKVSGPVPMPKIPKVKPGEEFRDTTPRTLVPATARRHGTLKAFRGEHGEEDAYTSGQWILATFFPNTAHGQRAKIFCRNRGVGQENGIESRVMVESSGPAGGYLVPEAMEAAIINLKEERGIARQECQIVPMPTETLLHPRRSGGVTVYAVGEADTITASDATIDQVQLTARKWAALTRFSTDLNEDSLIAFTDFLAREFAYGFADKEDEALFNGDGSSTYHGIFGVLPKGNDGNHAGTVYTALGGNTAFSTLDLVDFEGAIGQLPQYAATNAKWYISRAGFYASMQRLMDAAGGNTIDTLAMVSSVSAGRPIQFLGYPVVITQVLNSTLTAQASTAVLAFGDMQQAAMFGDRRGITLKISGERYFELDQMAMQATERMDIKVHELGGASAAGSLIVFVTGA